MEADDECVAYAEHLHHEHNRLNRLLLEIGGEIGELAGEQADRGVLQRLETRITDLRNQLKTHFAQEEAGGCLEEAVSRCPSLAGEMETVLKQHHHLDQLLCRVLAQVGDLATPAEIQASWQAFYTEIRAHEAAETRCLRMAFGHESAEYDLDED